MARLLRRIARKARDPQEIYPPVLRPVVAGVMFALVGFSLLVGLDALPRVGLWGDFAFALLVVSLCTWGVARSFLWASEKRERAWRRLQENQSSWEDFRWASFLVLTAPVAVIERLGIVRVELWQAPAWAALLLVGVPLAVITRWWGVGVVIAVFAVSLLVLRTWRRQWVLALWFALTVLAAIVLVELVSAFWLWSLAAGAVLALFLVLARGWLSCSSPPSSVSWLSALLAALAAVTFAQARAETLIAGRAHMQPSTHHVQNGERIARRYRPRLFFDGDEQFAPLDIDEAIANKRVHICHDTLVGPDCKLVKARSDFHPTKVFDARLDSLKIASDVLGPRDWNERRPSAYYYRVSTDLKTHRYYIDYWWYFAQNPNPVGKLVFCGPGLKWEVTCFDHEADWEGIVVELRPCQTAVARPKSSCSPFDGIRLRLARVGYAQHRGVKWDSWKQLRVMWSTLAWDPVSKQWIEARRGFPPFESGGRPLVFVALDSHASYPTPCPPSCKEPESHYNGRVHWWNNGSSCDAGKQPGGQEPAASCLQPLPVDPKTGEARSWNAFPGPWGYQKCILFGAYCDRARAPSSPSFQRRYLHPAGGSDEPPSGPWPGSD